MSEAADTAPLPVVPPLPVVAPKRRRRRWPWVLLVVVVVLAVAGVIGFRYADDAFRAQAEHEIETSVQNGLPNGVQGFARATIHGGPALLQYWNGHFDDVTVRMSDLHVDGHAATATAEVHDLPVNGGKIGSATVTLAVGQSTVRALAPLAGTGASAPTLGNGTITTTVTQKVLALTVLVQVTLKAALGTRTVTLTPTAATIRSGPFSVPATAIVQALYPHGISVCTAKYLPDGVTLSTLRITPGALTVTLAAKGIALDDLQAGGTGHC